MIVAFLECHLHPTAFLAYFPVLLMVFPRWGNHFLLIGATGDLTKRLSESLSNRYPKLEFPRVTDTQTGKGAWAERPERPMEMCGSEGPQQEDPANGNTCLVRLVEVVLLSLNPSWA